MAENSIAFAQNYTGILDEVYQRAGVSNVLNSGRRVVRAGRNAREIMIPKIQVTGLGDYTRNVGYKTGAITYEFETSAITYEFETKTFNYDRGIRLFADVMDVEEAGVLDCFVEAGAELQRTQVAPEADAFTFAQIVSHEGVTVEEVDHILFGAIDLLAQLCEATGAIDEKRVTLGSRYFSSCQHSRGPRRLQLCEPYYEQPRARALRLHHLGAIGALLYSYRHLSGDDDQFSYQKRAATYGPTMDNEVDSGRTRYTRSGLRLVVEAVLTVSSPPIRHAPLVPLDVSARPANM